MISLAVKEQLRKETTSRGTSPNTPRRNAYVLLETVIATGMLVVGLAVIGAQLQTGVTAVRKADLRAKAMALAETQLAQMSMGLIELDSVDAVQEDDFGPRYPQWAWRLTIDETALEGLFQLTVEVLHSSREEYRETFDYDGAEVIHTIHTFRLTPKPVSLGAAFGIPQEELDKLQDMPGDEECECLRQLEFSQSCFASIPSEALLKCIIQLMAASGATAEQIMRGLPPDIQAMIQASGLLDEIMGELEGGEENNEQEGGEQ